MKQLVLIITLMLFVLQSCDGRKSQHEALQQSIAEFSNTRTIEKDIYIPETYHEIISDSTLSNGFKTKIKTFTRMDENLVITVRSNNLLKRSNYRIIDGHVEVRFNNTLVFDEMVTKAFITRNQKVNHRSLEGFILSGIWINQEKSLDDNLLSLDILYVHIKNNSQKTFNLQINSTGHYYLNAVTN